MKNLVNDISVKYHLKPKFIFHYITESIFKASPRVIMVTMGKKSKKDKSDVIVKPEDIVTDTVMESAGDSEEDLKKSKKKRKKEKKKSEMSLDDDSVNMDKSVSPEEQPQESPKKKKKRNADTETQDIENPSPTKKIKPEGGSVVRSAKERMKVHLINGESMIILILTMLFFREIMPSFHPF